MKKRLNEVSSEEWDVVTRKYVHVLLPKKSSTKKLNESKLKRRILH
jgi:hypothetical protein